MPTEGSKFASQWLRNGILGAASALLALPGGAHAAAGLHDTAKASDRSGFTVIASAITDPDWLKKWNTTSPGVAFRGTDTLHAGDKATVAVFFSNALAVDGQAVLKCDVVVHNGADGSVQKSPPQVCFEGHVGPANMIMLTNMQINVGVDKGDPPGVAQFDIGVTDMNRHVRVPVEIAIKFDPAGKAN